MSRRRRRVHSARTRPSTEPKCPVTGKASYRNRVAAIAGRSRVIANWHRLGQAADKGELYTYRCPLDACAAWHLTSMNPATYVRHRDRNRPDTARTT